MMHHLDGMGDGTRAKSLATLTAPVISIFRDGRAAGFIFRTAGGAGEGLAGQAMN